MPISTRPVPTGATMARELANQGCPSAPMKDAVRNRVAKKRLTVPLGTPLEVDWWPSPLGRGRPAAVPPFFLTGLVRVKSQ